MDVSTGKITIQDLDKLELDSIANVPWALQLWEEVQENTKTSFLNWCSTVQKIAGNQPNVVKKWRDTYRECIDDALLEMVIDVVKCQNRTMDNVQKYLNQLQQICKELHVPMPDNIGAKQLCLYEEEKLLKQHIDEYEIIRNARREEVDRLNENQERLCRHLGQEPRTDLKYPPLPCQAELEEFKKYLEKLEQERFEREEQYYLLRDEIIKNVRELKYKPMDEFEKNVLSDEHMYATQENLNKLDMFSKRIKKMKKSTIEKCDYLRERVESLWSMMGAEDEDRADFMEHYHGYDLDVLDALTVEVRRCEEIRKANIKKTVEQLRKQLVEMWEKCHCSDKEKRQFKHMNNDCYTGDLLDLHDLEIEKWKSYYQKNGRLLELLNKHKELWEKIIQLEERANGPDRYKNRGGQLLKEEKERNKLSKQVPSIEQEILELAEEYQTTNGIPFFTYGRTPQEYIEYLHEERDNAKKVKLSARKMNATGAPSHLKSPINLFPSVSRAASPTTPARQRRPAAATPGTSRIMATPTPQKRKLMATPRTEGNLTKRRALTPLHVSSAKKQLSVPKIKITHTPMTLPSQKRRSSRSSMDKHKRRRSSRLERAASHENYSEQSEYFDFENELSTREKCRSTILPDNVFLAPPSTPRRVNNNKSPRKTPRTPGSSKKNNTKLTACKSNLKLIF